MKKVLQRFYVFNKKVTNKPHMFNSKLIFMKYRLFINPGIDLCITNDYTLLYEYILTHDKTKKNRRFLCYNNITL